MTDEISLNGQSAPNQAQRAHKLPQFTAAIDEAQRKLGLAGAVGTVTFVLYADGSCAFKPVGQVTGGLCKVIGEWGLNNLANYCAQMEQRSLEAPIASASPLRRN